MKKNFLGTFLPLLVALALLGTASFAMSGPRATADYGVASIAWQAAEGYDRGTLTVAGRTGIVRVVHFTGQDDLGFDLIGQNGNFLADGNYTYELITHDAANDRSRTTGFFSLRGGILLELSDGYVGVPRGQGDDGLVAVTEAVFDVDSSFTVSGKIGIGTMEPLALLHIAGSGKVAIILENTTTGGLYALGHEDAGFGLQYAPTINDPLYRVFGIENGAAEDALFITSSGRMALNGTTPGGLLEVNRCDGCPNGPFLRLNGANQVADAPTRLTIESADTSSGSASAQLHFVDQLAAKSATFEYRVLSGVPTFALNFVGTGNQDFRLTDKGEFRVGSGNTTTFEVTENGTALATAFVPTSARASKNNFRKISNQSVLERINSLDISRWSYLVDQGSDHIGPVAEEFFEAFGLGETDKGINLLDAAGVSMAAIQGLSEKLEARDATIATLEGRLARLETLVLEMNK